MIFFTGKGKKPVFKSKKPVIVTRPTPVDQAWNATRASTARIRKSKTSPADVSMTIRRVK